MAVKDLRPALRAFLLANGTIGTLVGAATSRQNGGSRVFPVKMPAGEKGDSIVYNEISSVGDHYMEGPSGLAQPRIQVAAWSKTIDGAHALGMAIKDAIDGYRGTMGDGATLINVQGVFFETWFDQYDDVAEMYGKVADYFVWYEER